MRFILKICLTLLFSSWICAKTETNDNPAKPAEGAAKEGEGKDAKKDGEKAAEKAKPEGEANKAKDGDKKGWGAWCKDNALYIILAVIAIAALIGGVVYIVMQNRSG